MSVRYVCKNCKKEYSPQELENSMWCSCGSYISKTACERKRTPPTENEDFIEPIHIPDEHKRRLKKAHEVCSEIIADAGFVPESLKTGFAVEAHRWFWKPKEVKFILVAESHVYTSADEVNVHIDIQKIKALVPDFPINAPTNFVKLVYCLGYGYSMILDHPKQIKFNPGTRQYAELFRKCVGLESPYRPGSLRWKANILKTVKARGLWLLDASCHACAKGRKERLPNKVVKRIIPESWNTYVQPIIDELDIDPEHVWIIGGGLQKLVTGKYSLGANWSYQPNAILGKELQEEKKRRNMLLVNTARRFLDN